MSIHDKRLRANIPGVYLARDESQPGRPLQTLLEVLARSLDELEQAIEQLHDDHFAERASEQALPLLAELIGARLLGNDTRANRAVVAHTLHWRRRKGALATLEEVLSETSGWSSEVDEAFRSLLQTQDLAYPLPWRGRTVVLWDPIALADPLSRRAPAAEKPRSGLRQRTPLLTVQADESTEDALRRLGRADAGRHAASPRTIDFTGWARPEIALIRSARFVSTEVDRLQLAAARAILPTDPASGLRFTGLQLDPLGRDLALVWQQPLTSADATGGLTERHEPSAEASAKTTVNSLLTPTALAADGDSAEQADAFSLFIDGVLAIGQQTAENQEFITNQPLSVLRFADSERPDAAGNWDLQLLSIASGQVELQISRQQVNYGYRRDNNAQWSEFTISERRGEPLSPVIRLDDAGTTVVARLERAVNGELALANVRPNDANANPNWQLQNIDLTGLADSDRPVITAAKDGPVLALLERNNIPFMVAPVAANNGLGLGLGVWRIDNALSATPSATRIDMAAVTQPSARMAPTVCLHNDVLFVFAGEDNRRVYDDLWSLAFTGAAANLWRPQRVRNRQARTGAILLSTAQGLVLLGGAAIAGELDNTVWRVDPDHVRPSWQALPDLPITRHRPGVLWARDVGTELEVLLWADRTAPQRLSWGTGELSWQTNPVERDNSPNPPAAGEVLFVDNNWLVLGPPPLPPSEVLFVIGGRGHLAFLPALDLIRDDDLNTFTIQPDGSSIRQYPPGVEIRGNLRIGAGREQFTDRRRGEGRLGVPERLQWQALALRQRNLEPWNQAIALQLDAEAGLDPRLGRIVLRAQIAPLTARYHASYYLGRGGELGAGFLPPDQQPPEYWQETPDPEQAERFSIPIPPQLDHGRAGGAATVQAWIDPQRAGMSLADIPVLATPEQGLSADAIETAETILAILGSPRLAPANLVLAQNSTLSLYADAGYPHLTADNNNVSMTVHERLQEDADPDLGPGIFLAGLSLAGRIDVALTAGQVDLRWCNLATAGDSALVVVGAGHQSALARYSLPTARLTVRLYGCLVGRIELPPWVELIAAGCTFDAGNSNDIAIAASGASLRLRHCTVHGGVAAGRLEASSCAFKSALFCDRPDQGWLRYSLLDQGGLDQGGRPPQLLYQSLITAISFASIRPTEPNYLVLADNNSAAVLSAGERRRLPGAYAERSQRLLELNARTEDYLPMSLLPYHVDRATVDLLRMNRRTP